MVATPREALSLLLCTARGIPGTVSSSPANTIGKASNSYTTLNVTLEMPGPDMYQKLCSLAIFALFWLADSSLPGWTGCGLGRRPLSWPRQKMAKWQTGSRTANLCQRPDRVKWQQSAGVWFPALPAHSFRYHASCHDMLHVILALLLKPRFSAGMSGCLAMHILGLQRLFHSREGAWHKVASRPTITNENSQNLGTSMAYEQLKSGLFKWL